MSIVIEGIVHDGKIVPVNGPELTDGQRVQVVIGPEPEEGTIFTPLTDPVLADLLDRIRRDRQPLPPGPSGAGRKSAAGMLATDPTWDEDLRDVLDSRKAGTCRKI